MKKQGSGNREQGSGKAAPARRAVDAAPAKVGVKVSPARRVAAEILLLVGQGRGHSDELLHSARTEGLSAEDRGLATALVMGVLRWQIALDARVRGLLERPGQRLAEPVAVALRMGAFQLLHMDRIPAHAALSESVELCRVANEPHATGMVNAVLRKIATAPKQGVKLHESVEGFAERLGHPAWLVERWVTAYGRVAAMKICEAGQVESAAGGMFVEGETDLPVMDDGSRLVAEIAAAAVPMAKKVWDCCAAPGGKTLMLARRLGGAEISATDVSAKRVAQMEARLKRYEYAAGVKFGVADAVEGVGGGEQPTLHKGVKDGSPNVLAPDILAGEFDLILCDVPCSGTGTLASNPEIRHRLKPEEFVRQAERQRAILKGALERLAPGGRLVYSTCSLEAEECEAVVDVVAGEFKRVPVEGLIAGFAGILKADLGTAVRDGALRTLPGVHGCDGFYAVVLER